ncbi:MAG TPA: hypothetical protein VGS08_04385 [Candidatus Saccharimonadales bacterium]|nr:hypothetical protein [Candidatus Saccharimonadales bacterium]
MHKKRINWKVPSILDTQDPMQPLALPDSLMWPEYYSSSSELAQAIEKYPTYTQAWQELFTKYQEVDGLLFCPSALNGWLKTGGGWTVLNLNYTTLMSAKQYRTTIERLGLARSFMWSTKETKRTGWKTIMGILSGIHVADPLNEFCELGGHGASIQVLPERAITESETYRQAIASMDTSTDAAGILLEGKMIDESTLELADGGKINTNDWHVSAYSLPDEPGDDLQLVELMVEDQVQIRLHFNEKTGGLSAMALIRGEQRHRDTADIDHQAVAFRQVSNIVHQLENQSPDIASQDQIYEMVQAFYDRPYNTATAAEGRLRTRLSAAGFYVVEPFLREVTDPAYVGRPVTLVCDDVIENTRKADIATLKANTIYLYTFSKYTEEYNRLVDAMLERADDLGCTGEYLAMLNAVWSRDPNEDKRYILTAAYMRIATRSTLVEAQGLV